MFTTINVQIYMSKAISSKHVINDNLVKQMFLIYIGKSH